MKWILFWMYGIARGGGGRLPAAPKTAVTFYAFAAVLGPHAGSPRCRRPRAWSGKLFGTRYLATLFGLTLLSHQIGGFFGAWLGGLAIERAGSYDWMWYADIALAAAAALVNLPIREANAAFSRVDRGQVAHRSFLGPRE